MEPYQPSGIYSLLQDLYTPQEYNPAEYTLMGYDTEAYLGGVPVGSYDMTAATGPQGSYYATESQGAMADPAAQNAAVEAAAAANLAEARARGDIVEWDPSMGIASMPKEQQVGFGGYDALGLKYDDKGRAYDVLGRMVKDEYGRGAVGLTAQQAGITPEMAARGYTLADVWR